MPEHRLDAVLFEREPGYWVGQFLQYDLGAQAFNLPDLAYELQRTIVGHFAICHERGLEPFAGLASAPAMYWQMFDDAKITVGAEQAGFSLPTPVPATRMKVAQA